MPVVSLDTGVIVEDSERSLERLSGNARQCEAMVNDGRTVRSHPARPELTAPVEQTSIHAPNRSLAGIIISSTPSEPLNVRRHICNRLRIKRGGIEAGHLCRGVLDPVDCGRDIEPRAHPFQGWPGAALPLVPMARRAVPGEELLATP